MTRFQLLLVPLLQPPGCVKTAAARERGDRAFLSGDMVSLGRLTDTHFLTGSARGWASAQPGVPVAAAYRQGYGNPMLGLEEIEKAAIRMGAAVR